MSPDNIVLTDSFVTLHDAWRILVSDGGRELL